MATEQQINDLRDDIGADATSLTDADAARIFERAGAAYPGDTPAMEAEARVIAIRQLLGSSARLVSYKANQSSESLSDISKHLRELLVIWEDEVERAVTAASPDEMRWGMVKRRPSRLKEYPDASTTPR